MIIDLFPTPVMMVNVKDRLKTEDIKFIQKWAYDSGYVSRQDNPLDAKEDDFYFLDRILPDISLKMLLEEYTNKFLHDVWKENNNRVVLTTSWINSMPAGRSIERHMHRNSVLSGVLYIDVDAGHSGFTIHKPIPRHIVGYTTKENKYTQDEVIIKPSCFDLVIFPGTIEHSVTPHNSETNRISLAFNTFYVGDIHTNDQYGSFGATTIAKATITGWVG